MDTCYYCKQSTAGNHERNCPNSIRMQGSGDQVWSFPATGWECPVCHRVYAPSVAECQRCNELPPIMRHFTNAISESVGANRYQRGVRKIW